MSQQSIQLFKTNIKDLPELTVPVSLDSAELGIGALSDGVLLTANVRLDGVALSARYIYLRINDATPITDVRIGGKSVGFVYDGRGSASVSVKPFLREGDNTLEILLDSSLPSVGILGGVSLISFRGAAIDGMVLTERLEGGAVTLGISLSVLGSADNVRAVATLVSGSGQMYYGGLTGLSGTITVRDPLYWWPKGLGIQNLYKLTVNLYGDMEIEDTLEVKVGLRSFAASRSAVSSMLEINGESFLPMGAVYRPEERKPDAGRSSREAAALAAAARCGFNTLVIPHDAPIPTDEALSLCDAYGISVIIGVELSDRESLVRLASLSGKSYHPSLAMLDLFGDESLVAEAREALRFIAPDIAVGYSEKALSYPSFASLPTVKTLLSELAPEERNLYSERLERDDGELIEKMVSSMAKSYLYPSTISEVSYVSGINAAARAKSFIVATRMARGTLGRAVYSSLYDTSLCVSDSSLDCYAGWKPLQYYSQRVFAPVIISCEYKGEGCVSFYISNERRQSFVGTLDYRIIDKNNRVLYTESAPCEIDRSSSKHLFSRDLSASVIGREREIYLEYVLRDPTGIHSRDVLFFVQPKRFDFVDPDIRAEVMGSDRRFSVTVSASAFASAVELEFPESDVVLSDNYLDLTSGAPVKLSLAVTGGIETAQHLARTMKIRSLYDLKRPKEII